MHNFSMFLTKQLTDAKDKPALFIAQEQGAPREVTHAALMAQAQRAAMGLMEQGFEPGTRAGFVASNGDDWLLVALAVWMAGGCVVPLVPGRERRETLRCLARSGCDWIIVRDVAGLDHIRGQAANLPEHLRWLMLESANAPAVPGVMTLDAVLAAGKSRNLRGGPQLIARRMYDVPPQQPALVLFDYEPGEDPHGAIFSSGKLAIMIKLLGEDLLLPEGARVGATLSFGWFHALMMALATLGQGRALIFGATVGELVRQLPALKPTHLICGPAFVEAQAARWQERIERAPEFLKKMGEGGGLARALGGLGERAAQLALVEPIQKDMGGNLAALYIVGGQLPDAAYEVLERAGIPALGVWGVPEAGITHMERAGAQRRGSVGRPVQGYACKVDGKKDGEPGTVLVRADTLFDGYWDQQGPRAITEGWLDTATTGRVEGGYLFIV
jgi:long-chain acyl-CoA synthetase